MMIGRASKSKRFWIGAVCASLLVIFLCGLGIWQLQRLEWKNALIQNLRDPNAIKAAIALSPAQVSPHDPTPILFFGKYHPEHTIFVRNGNHMIVYMPFETEDGTFILMRRGIMKVTDMADQVISQSDEPGSVSVVGLPVPQPSGVPMVRQPDPGALIWTLLDWDAVKTKLQGKTVANYIVAVLDEPADALDLNRTMPLPRNEHLQYATFWFAMALIAALLFGRFLLTTPGRKEVERDDI